MNRFSTKSFSQNDGVKVISLRSIKFILLEGSLELETLHMFICLYEI